MIALGTGFFILLLFVWSKGYEHQVLRDMIRQQDGLMYKFTRKNGQFVHTLCDGELLYKLGFTPEQIIGKTLKDFVPEEHYVEKLDCYNRAWGGEVVYYEGNINGIIYVAILRPIQQDGKTVEVIGSCIDITDRKRTEKELREENFHLTRLKEKAEAANLAKSNFLSKMSHELRTPLNSILGFAQLLEEETTSLPKRQKGMVQKISYAGNHLLFLFNEILDLARIEAGQTLLKMEVLKAHTVLEEAIKMIEPIAKKKILPLFTKISVSV